MSHVVRLLTLGALFTLVLAVLGIPGEATAHFAPAAVIQVNPGPRAIRKALKHANPGDTLNIHSGTYNEAVRVRKANVTLQAAGDGVVVIDAQCNAESGINLEAEGITIKGLTVQGALEYAINVVHHSRAFIRKNTVLSTCAGAEYGVNIFDGGSVLITGNTGSGWDDAVVYVGGINATPDGALKVKGTNASASVRGIIIEDSTNVNILVAGNQVHDNTDTGILIHNSDGILIRNNTVTNNTTNGIHLDSPSDDNVVRANTFTGHTFDINNEGTGNCFSGNTFVTSNGDTSLACP